MATLSELKTQLASAESALSAALTAGQSYSITGSHSVTAVNVTDLREHIKDLRRRILRFHGHDGQTKPDFSGDVSNDY